MLKKILTISTIVLVALALMALIGFSYHLRSNEYINGVTITIDHNPAVGFLDKSELMEAVNPADTLLSYKIVEFDSKSIEELLSQNPFIEHVDCYCGLNGGVFINLKEKTPIVRVYEKNNKSYYIDEQGDFFPIHKHHAPRTIIANGYLNDLRQKEYTNVHDSVYANTPLLDLYKLVKAIREDQFLNAQISQIYHNSKDDWELVPELGGHIIQLGQLENLDKKFENLKAFYHELSRRNGWNDYKIINLSFNNQIVCTKK